MPGKPQTPKDGIANKVLGLFGNDVLGLLGRVLFIGNILITIYNYLPEPFDSIVVLFSLTFFLYFVVWVM